MLQIYFEKIKEINLHVKSLKVQYYIYLHSILTNLMLETIWK